MGQPQRISSPGGLLLATRPTLRLVPVIRTSSTPPASPCTERRWIRADLISTEASYPEPLVPEQAIRRKLIPLWHTDAKCRGTEKPDDMFFGEKDPDDDGYTTRTSLTITKIREVKEFCRSCPVFVQCLTHALTMPERHGIWAGTSKRTRQRILALVDLKEITIAEVVGDYLEGRERKYESIRRREA